MVCGKYSEFPRQKEDREFLLIDCEFLPLKILKSGNRSKMPDISDVLELQLQRFSWSDYTCFVMMLLVCIVIGIYFGFFEKKQNTEDEYLVGGRNMPIIPVAFSLVAR